MSSSALTTTLLRASADGYAGLAASRLFDEAEEAPEGFKAWRAHLRRQLLSLAAALEDGSPERFAEEVAWSQGALAARQVDTSVLTRATEALSEVLQESLPPAAWAPLPPYLEKVRERLGQGYRVPTSELEAAGGHADLARDYVAAVRLGDEERATQLVLDALGNGLGGVNAFENVLAPAQREVGRLWHAGELSVAEEHLASAVTRRVILRVVERSECANPNGRTVLISGVEGDLHELGLELAAGCFELAGWRVLFLGANTPPAELARVVAFDEIHVVAVGATLDVHRQGATSAVEAVRSAQPDLPVLLGGAAYRSEDSLWERSGADGRARSAAEAVTLATRLAEGA